MGADGGVPRSAIAVACRVVENMTADVCVWEEGGRGGVEMSEDTRMEGRSQCWRRIQ